MTIGLTFLSATGPGWTLAVCVCPRQNCRFLGDRDASSRYNIIQRSVKAYDSARDMFAHKAWKAKVTTTTHMWNTKIKAQTQMWTAPAYIARYEPPCSNSRQINREGVNVRMGVNVMPAISPLLRLYKAECSML